MDFDADNPLAVEIRQEMAAAYFAACKRMVEALEALRAFDRAMVTATPEHEQSTRRCKLLHDAAERVFFVVIQREALELPCYEAFFKDYEIPDEVRTLMGVPRT